MSAPPLGPIRRLWHRPMKPGLYWARQAGTKGRGELRDVAHGPGGLGVYGWQGGGAGSDFQTWTPVEESCFEFWGPIEEPPPD